LKVLLLSQFFSTTRGGGEYLFSILAKKLSENDHMVWVVTNKIIDETYENKTNLTLVFIPPTLKYEGGLPPTFLENLKYIVNGIKMGLRIIKNEKIDIIHSNNFSPALVGSILSVITSKPHVTSIWDVFTLCGKDYWKKWTKQKGVSKIHGIIGPRFEKLVTKVPSKFIHTISDATKDDLIRFGTKKPIHVVSPAIEESIKENVVLNPFQFIYVGRLVFYKNIEVLIRAIHIAQKTEPRIKLLVVGDGPHKEELINITKKLEIESNIEFRGYVTAKEKAKLISQSNSLVFPSLCEGFGLVILEAFSQSKPVLVSDVRPLSDIVLHGRTGYVLNPNDEKIWAECLLKLAKNPHESEKMGKNGFDLIKTKYNEDLMYQKIFRLYEEAIQKPS